MRQVFAAAFLTAVALWASPSAATGSGHWFCTGDGIKSWTDNPNMSDASGWNYSGNRSAYKDDGKCEKKM
jgi:hypothetical protein